MRLNRGRRLRLVDNPAPRMSVRLRWRTILEGCNFGVLEGGSIVRLKGTKGRDSVLSDFEKIVIRQIE
jgi:hypothetical protein